MEQVDFILALKDSDLHAKLNRPCKLQLLFILCLIFKIGFAYRILISRLWLYKILCVNGDDECNYDNALSNDDNKNPFPLKILVQLNRRKNMRKLSRTFLCA